MIIVLSGEGKTDLGECDFGTKIFKAGAMYIIVDKLIEQVLGYSPYELSKENLHYIYESDLTLPARKLKVLRGKKLAVETGFFYKNARVVAQIAKEKDADLAILFRDSDVSDRKEWQSKYKSILNGFTVEGFYKGVAMLPRPKSEVWLLCALKNRYQNCQKLEDESSGNDNSPKNLKDMLNVYGFSHEELCDMIKNDTIDVNKIDMNSFSMFKDRLIKIMRS